MKGCLQQIQVVWLPPHPVLVRLVESYTLGNYSEGCVAHATMRFIKCLLCIMDYFMVNAKLSVRWDCWHEIYRLQWRCTLLLGHSLLFRLTCNIQCVGKTFLCLWWNHTISFYLVVLFRLTAIHSVGKSFSVPLMKSYIQLLVSILFRLTGIQRAIKKVSGVNHLSFF